MTTQAYKCDLYTTMFFTSSRIQLPFEFYLSYMIFAMHMENLIHKSQ